VNKPWLGIDTTTDVMSVEIGTWEGGGGDHSAGARQHAAQIIPMVKRVLGDTRLQDLAGIVVGDGPGSFTGLRIAWAAARGLAHQIQLPILAVPTLHAVAYANAVDKPGPALVCIDALRGQVFAAIYAFPEGRLETLLPPGLFTIPELVRIAPAVPARAFLDDGAGRYANEIEKWIGRAPVGVESLHRAAEGLIALAPLVGNAANGEPVYGRSAEAQVKWEARHGRPLPNSSR
jgi:tRNA threonylcarbamoyladenosine biosynthesis protein TsaB